MSVLALLLSLNIAFAAPQIPPAQIAKICFQRGAFIYLSDQKSGEIKRLVKGDYPSLSADGKVLAFSVSNGSADTPVREIKLLDIGKKRVRSFPSLKGYLCFGASWSPDGKKIAFNVMIKGGWAVGIVNPTTSQWRVVTNKPQLSSAGLSSWVADGESILCNDLENLYQVDLKGNIIKIFAFTDIVGKERYVAVGSRFSLSPNGKLLLFVTDGDHDITRPPAIWLYDLDQKMRTRVPDVGFPGSDPQWLPSGQEFIFTARLRQRESRSHYGIYRMRLGDEFGPELLLRDATEASVVLAR